MRAIDAGRPRSIVVAAAIAALLCAVAAVGIARALGTNGKAPLTNPDAELSDAQREAKYASGRASFEAHYASWIAALDVSTLPFGSLPRSDIMASYLPPLPDLDSAVQAADLVVSGIVTSIQPDGHGSIATLSVTAVTKGSPAAALTLHQAGGFQPTPDWTGVVISDSEAAPTLLPGDRVVLLLRKSGTSPDGYEALSFVGTYRITDGGLAALPGNPFAASVNGLSEAALLERIAAAGK